MAGRVDRLDAAREFNRTALEAGSMPDEGSSSIVPDEPSEWEAPLAFNETAGPEFPTEIFPPGIRAFVEAMPEGLERFGP